jgi:hypothetical protein
MCLTPPVEVTDHRIYKGWWTGCQKWREATVDWHDQWGNPQSSRLPDPHGTRQSLWYLDGTAPESFPPMPGYPLPEIFFRSRVNNIKLQTV